MAMRRAHKIAADEADRCARESSTRKHSDAAIITQRLMHDIATTKLAAAAAIVRTRRPTTRLYHPERSPAKHHRNHQAEPASVLNKTLRADEEVYSII